MTENNRYENLVPDDDDSAAVRKELRKIQQLKIPKRNVCFIHIPKNAGTAVQRVLFRRTNGIAGHITATQINSFKKYQLIDNFAFCRDPFSRFVSVYLWRLRKDELVKELGMKGVLDILTDDNVKQPLAPFGFEETPGKLDRMFLPQNRWINENTIYIGRVERLHKEFLKLKSMYGLGFEWTKTEQNVRHNPAKTYGPQPAPTRKALIQVLQEDKQLGNKFFDYYAEDYQKFGYNIPKELKNVY
tara:strand:+ start:1124 stop:1855 length:732 start_codon:yes stop_codon:yes gene_type:complete